MTKDALKGKKIAVFGLGVEGQASARFLATCEAQVTVLDERQAHEIDDALLHALRELGVECVFGKDAFSHWEGAEMIVRSAGVRRSRPEILAAEQQGVTITSIIKLFFELCPVPIIGVTGTKGKGTTSTLIYEMLNTQGEDVYLGGNIGKAPLVFLDRLTPTSKVVLELSSFQLEDLTQSPDIAVMLMVTSEHLAADTTGTANYHDSLEEYVKAKQNIVAHQTAQDVAILNADYPNTMAARERTPGQVFLVSQHALTGEDGCFVREEAVWLRIKGQEEKVIDVSAIALPGRHNLENVCAATMAARMAGVRMEPIRRTLSTFRGLEHRLELVAEANGVKYYDDSFSTTPETAIAAIQAFSAPKILILGGSTKASDFSELAQTIAANKTIRAIIGIGAEWERIKATLAPFTLSIPCIEGLTEMSAMVHAAQEVAQPGDVVLLSPACASFGLFPNYKVRGDQFKAAVRALNESHT